MANLFVESDFITAYRRRSILTILYHSIDICIGNIADPAVNRLYERLCIGEVRGNYVGVVIVFHSGLIFLSNGNVRINVNSRSNVQSIRRRIGLREIRLRSYFSKQIYMYRRVSFYFLALRF